MHTVSVDRSSLKSINRCDSQSWQKFKSTLASCNKCERKFFPYRLDTHLRWCSGNAMLSSSCRGEEKGEEEDAATTAAAVILHESKKGDEEDAKKKKEQT